MKKIKLPWWGWVMFCAFGLVVINAASNRSVDSVPPPPEISIEDQDNSLDAVFMMQHFVKDRLKSPSSAEFPNPYSGKGFIVRKEGDVYFVTSTVEALNPFGVRLRMGFAGRVKQVDKENWQLVELAFIN